MYHSSFDQINKNEFLEKYWQKAPCLFRGAFLEPPEYLSADVLAGLSLQDDIESRLLVENNQSGSWQIQHGPFDESDFSNLPESHWTLLVQSIDTWISDTKQLLAKFDFIPRWRFDDIMVSYATDQGGVGPHADNYDVFLIQGTGNRHWRVGRKGNTSKSKTVIEGISHLEQFDPIIDIVMQPGDMLYIPPDTPHWGQSQGESIGYSIGYRSIQTHQMLALITEKMAEKSEHCQFFADDYRNKSNFNNFFEHEVVEWAQSELIKLANQPELLAELLSKQLSLSKLGVYDEHDSVNLQELTENTEIQLLNELGVNWFVHQGKIRLNIEGESFDFNRKFEKAVKILASYQPTALKLFNFSPKSVDFPSELATLVNRGYVKSIK